jgi:hypothetical protein
MSLGIIPFSKIFLTVLFDILTNNVSYLALHLFKCVALLCIYIIVIINLLISDKELNTLLNDTIFVSLRYFFNFLCQVNMATLQVKKQFLTNLGIDVRHVYKRV